MTDLTKLTRAMRACEQTKGLSVLAHGIAVRNCYAELISHLRDGQPLLSEWRLPGWASSPILLSQLLTDDLMARYQVFHDCGKPHALTIDADGRRHFPDHAAASERAWRAAGGGDQEARLIGMDMDIHLLKDTGVAEFATRPEATSLLYTGLTEIHANAAMFGGIKSISFKAKWKQIDRRGRAILKTITASTPQKLAS